MDAAQKGKVNREHSPLPAESFMKGNRRNPQFDAWHSPIYKTRGKESSERILATFTFIHYEFYLCPHK